MTNEFKKKKKNAGRLLLYSERRERKKDEKKKGFSGDAAQSLVHTMMMSRPTAYLTMARPD